MAQTPVDVTTPQPGGRFGDPAKTAYQKINSMFAEVYGWAGNGALAKLIGGNNFVGPQRFQPLVASDQVVIRDLGDGRVVLDAISADTTQLRPVVIRGSQVDIATPLTVAGIATFNSTTSAPSLNAVGSQAQLNFVDRTDFSRTWSWYSSGAIARLFFSGVGDRLNVNGATGAVGAVSFNPTSSADVKDYIEGYASDACAELDRLAVITYKYRPEFGGPEGTVAGLLAENVKSVWPNAVGGDYDEVVTTPALLPDGTAEVDQDGSPVMVEETRHVPMNVDMMQTLARTVRAHQQKSRRIKQLEAQVAALQEELCWLAKP